ncbi:MAG: sulfatase [Verrucomicrobia bacterium]|nr:sulfatase [Verrucomicrobiota bacterium]
MKRTPSILVLLLALGVGISGGTLFATDAKRPNILLITADDLGLNLSCYGEKRIATPKLDAMAAEGVLFRNAYVAQSSCSASRAALLTGRWPHQNGQVGLAHLGFRMHSGQPTMPALLKAAGYRTGIIGKLHVEPAAEFPFDWMPKEKTAPLPTRNVRWVAEQSRAFLASAKAAGRRFFYYVNYMDPHGPLNKETDQIAGLPEKPLTATAIKEPIPLNATDPSKNAMATARLLNSVMRIDAGIGLLLDELKAAGFAENTMVIFVGDNGTAMPRGKTTCYETGVRVPMLMRWPGSAKAGQVRAETVSLLDLMPTVLAACGVKAPDTLVGAALQPLLRGESAADWRELLFTEMNFHTPDVFRPQRTVRDRRYKLVLNLAPNTEQPAVELFDLQNDPNETKNLSADPAHADARKKLETAMQGWREKRGDPLLDAARLQRWKDAAASWAKQPRVKAGFSMVVRVPEGGLELLR